jgi:acyl-CoA oxidase
VDREGSVEMNGDMRALYTTMMMIRYTLIYTSKISYSQALLIALRYSVVRRQFKNISGQKEETKLLDYQTQQMKLFPILANMYTHCYTAEVIYEMYENFCQDVEK